MISLWSRFCHDTPMHGFHEMFCAKSLCSKLVWYLIMVVGLSMTSFQIYIVLENFYSNPTKTEINVLPYAVTPKLPPYVFCVNFFAEWLNVSKVEYYKLDLETFLYVMSYFNTIYTKYPVDTVKANAKVVNIMKSNNFETLYDFGISLASTKPSSIISNDKFDIFFNKDFQELCYIHRFHETFYNNSYKDELTNHNFNTETFTDFQRCDFSIWMNRTFNYSMSDEYESFNYEYQNIYEFNVDLNNLQSSMPVYVNVAGGRRAFYEANILANSYNFYLKGTLYKWISTADKKCSNDREPLFYADCLYRCQSELKILSLKTCELYFIPDNIPRLYHYPSEDLENSCTANLHRLSGDQENLWRFEKCIENCTSSCDQWKYEFTVLRFSNNFDAENSTFIRGGIVIYFDDADNMLMVSLLPSVTWDLALASVGGLLGLWLGGSVISFLHILYIFCYIPVEVWLSKRSPCDKGELFSRNSTKKATETNLREIQSNDSLADSKTMSTNIQTDINNLKTTVMKYSGELKEPLLEIVNVLSNLHIRSNAKNNVSPV